MILNLSIGQWPWYSLAIICHDSLLKFRYLDGVNTLCPSLAPSGVLFLSWLLVLDVSMNMERSSKLRGVVQSLASGSSLDHSVFYFLNQSKYLSHANYSIDVLIKTIDLVDKCLRGDFLQSMRIPDKIQSQIRLVFCLPPHDVHTP